MAGRPALLSRLAIVVSGPPRSTASPPRRAAAPGRGRGSRTWPCAPRRRATAAAGHPSRHCQSWPTLKAAPTRVPPPARHAELPRLATGAVAFPTARRTPVQPGRRERPQDDGYAVVIVTSRRRSRRILPREQRGERRHFIHIVYSASILCTPFWGLGSLGSY